MKSTAVLFFVLLPVVAFGDIYRETVSLELSSAGIRELVVRCGAGDLILRGDEESDRIIVAAEIQAEGVHKSDFQLFLEKQIRLDLKRDKNKALLFSDVAALPFTEVEARIHLNIELPSSIDIRIVDGSGPIVVSDIVGNLEINDDSGAIRVENITGRIVIKDGSGGIEVEDIQGDVEISDGSGEIVMHDVTGDVKIIDGTGSIAIYDIGGNVTVSDESGSIEIYKVAKNVYIRESLSGEIDIQDVKGKVTLRD